MLEFEVDHTMLHIQRLVEDDLAWVDVKSEPMAEYNEKLQEAIAKVEAWQAGCTDY